MKTLRLYLLFAAVLSWGLWSCQTDVPLHEGPHPHNGMLKFSYQWSTPSSFVPDTMIVVAFRVLNQFKMSYAISSKGGDGYQIRTNALSPTNFDQVSDKGVAFSVPTGRYKFYTFNMENDELEHTSVRQYLEDPSMGREEIFVRYKTYDKNDKSLKLSIPGWTDYNQYTNYLQYNVSAIYYDSLSQYEIGRNKVYYIQFQPHELSQKVDLYFSIKKDISKQGFTVDSVFAEISGVPRSFNITTGYLDVTTTYKMMFQTDKITDKDNNAKVSCHAELHVPGILPSRQPDIYMGPGIMQAIVYCSALNPVDGKRMPKRFQGKINLFNTLQRTPSIRLTDDKKSAVKTQQALRLDIQTEMPVDGEKILETSDADSGVDVWKASTDNTNPVDL